MKTVMTTIEIAVLLLSAASADAVVRNLTQNGIWSVASTWNAADAPDTTSEDVHFTDSDGTPYTVTITGDANYGATTATTGSTMEFASGKTLTSNSMEIDATSRAVTITQTREHPLSTGGTVSVTDSPGTFVLNSGTVDGRHAKYQLSFGAIAFTSMTLDGDVASNSNAKAILDLDQSVGQSSSDVTVKRVADIEVLSGKMFIIDDLLVGSESGDYEATLTVNAGGTLSAGSVVVEGDTGGSGSTIDVDSSILQTR